MDTRIDPALVTRFARDLHALSGPLAPEAHLGIAVSGGPDSLALLLLAHAAHPGQVTAATVDHQLRPEAPAEAAAVARLCATLGVPHATLPAPAAPAGGGLQAAARQARYAALARWAEEASVPYLLTAHHADDQAETLLMRLNRGSGVAGLAGVRAVRPLAPAVTLLRPLLAWRRAELAVIAAPHAPAADSSNADPRHDRTHARAHLGAAPWLDAAALAQSAAHLAQAEDALAWAVDRLWGERARRNGDAWALHPADLPPELLRRMVLRALRAVSPEAAPRGAELSNLIAGLHAGATATLCSVLASGGAAWRFSPAPPRRS